MGPVYDHEKGELKTEEKTEVIIDDKIIPLRIINEDIEKGLFEGLGLDTSKISKVSTGKNRSKPLKQRKRPIDKESILKRNAFHNKVMRRY